MGKWLIDDRHAPGLALKRSKTAPEFKFYASVDEAGNVAVHKEVICR